MPNHNIPFLLPGGYPNTPEEALKWHLANDGAVEDIVLEQPNEITKRMYRITLRDEQFEADLAAEIARIANLSRDLGEKLRARRGVMTSEEAFGQLGHSASLLRAVLEYYGRKK